MVRPALEEDAVRNAASLSPEELRPEFRQQMELLRAKLAKVQPKKLFDQLLDGQNLVDLARSYVATMNQGGVVPSIKGAWEYVVDQSCATARALALEFYTQGIRAAACADEEGKLVGVLEFMRVHNSLVKEALKVFETKAVSPGHKKAKQCKDELVELAAAELAMQLEALEHRSEQQCKEVAAAAVATNLQGPLERQHVDGGNGESNEEEGPLTGDLGPHLVACVEAYDDKAQGPAREAVLIATLTTEVGPRQLLRWRKNVQEAHAARVAILEEEHEAVVQGEQAKSRGLEMDLTETKGQLVVVEERCEQQKARIETQQVASDAMQKRLEGELSDEKKRHEKTEEEWRSKHAAQVKDCISKIKEEQGRYKSMEEEKTQRLEEARQRHEQDVEEWRGKEAKALSQMGEEKVRHESSVEEWRDRVKETKEEKKKAGGEWEARLAGSVKDWEGRMEERKAEHAEVVEAQASKHGKLVEEWEGKYEKAVEKSREELTRERQEAGLRMKERKEEHAEVVVKHTKEVETWETKHAEAVKSGKEDKAQERKEWEQRIESLRGDWTSRLEETEARAKEQAEKSREDGVRRDEKEAARKAKGEEAAATFKEQIKAVEESKKELEQQHAQAISTHQESTKELEQQHAQAIGTQQTSISGWEEETGGLQKEVAALKEAAKEAVKEAAKERESLKEVEEEKEEEWVKQVESEEAKVAHLQEEMEAKERAWEERLKGLEERSSTEAEEAEGKQAEQAKQAAEQAEEWKAKVEAMESTTKESLAEWEGRHAEMMAKLGEAEETLEAEREEHETSIVGVVSTMEEERAKAAKKIAIHKEEQDKLAAEMEEERHRLENERANLSIDLLKGSRASGWAAQRLQKKWRRYKLWRAMIMGTQVAGVLGRLITQVEKESFYALHVVVYR
jgi:hypothetical protein